MNLPNLITTSRMLLSLFLFWVMGYAHENPVLMGVGVLGLTLCAVSDWLDGYIARKQNLETVFGRIADPFADKFLLCGLFIMMLEVTPHPQLGSAYLKPWMVMAIVSREFLISSLRGYAESRGIAFGAGFWGKLKVGFQYGPIYGYFIQRAWVPLNSHHVFEGSGLWFDTLVELSVMACWLVTVYSALPYILKARKAFREDKTL